MEFQDQLEVLDDFLDEITKEGMAAAPKAPMSKYELKQTQKSELDMWHSWNKNGRKPEHLKPLLKSFQRIRTAEANKWIKGNVEIPSSAIHAEVNKHFVEAMKTFDPGKSALGSWVQTKFKFRMPRFVKIYQNMGKIPEDQIKKIRPFREAKAELTDRLGYEPDIDTLADYMKMPKRRIAQLQKEDRRSIPASTFETDPTDLMAPREAEAARLMMFGLPKDHKLVYEYTFGVNNKPVLKPGQIAKVTGFHPSKISRIRKDLQTKLMETVEAL